MHSHRRATPAPLVAVGRISTTGANVTNSDRPITTAPFGLKLPRSRSPQIAKICVVRNKLRKKAPAANRTRQGISEKKAQLEFQVQDRKLIVCIHLWNTPNQLQVDEKARVVIKCKFKARRFSSPHALGTNFGFYEP
jgi:hypothetical protein